MRPLLLPFLLLFTITVFAQEDTRYNYNYIHTNKFDREDVTEYFDFTELDKKVRKFKYNVPNVRKLAFNVTKAYETDIEKVRAIYIWITENIEFDLKKYEKKPKREKIKCGSDADCQQKFKEQIDEEIKVAIRKQKGIAEDYSRLFARMLDLSGVEGGYIAGRVKLNDRDIGRIPKGANHSWNWAKIDGKVYLFDATLGSGFTDDKFTEFNKSYNETYFMVRPEKMILTHFPSEVKDQHKYPYTTKEEFGLTPLYLNDAKLIDKIEIAPAEGMQKVSEKKNKIAFEFNFSKEVTAVQLKIPGSDKPLDLDKGADGKYTTTYFAPKRVPKKLTIQVSTDYGQTFEILQYKLKKVADE